jgi:uncharacterized membrane protein YgcG
MNPQKKMYKVISAMEKKGGGTYWMRIGSGFTNRDDSINLYLDAVPAPNGTSRRYELQIRELDAEDLRRRESYSANAGGSGNGSGNVGGGAGGGGGFASGSGSYGRDLGGIGGGPSTRAVTANATDDVPF